MPWLWLVVCVLVTAHAALRLRTRRARRLLAGLPSLPFLGNVLELGGGSRGLFQLVERLTSIAEEARKPIIFYLGPWPNLVITEPDDIKTVSNVSIEKPFFYKFSKDWVGNGLITAPGYIWKQNVKELGNFFNSAVVGGYQNAFNAQAKKLVHALKKHAGQSPINIMNMLSFTTLESICHVVLGTNDESELKVSEEYFKAYHRCQELLVQRGVSPLLYPDCVYRLTSAYKDMMANLAVILDLSRGAMKQKKTERERRKFNAISTDETKMKTILDFLLDMAEQDPHVTEDYIREELDTIIFAGHETTATAMFYMFLMIGCNPQVEQKLQQELQTIFEGSVRPVQREDLPRMEYCEAVILETLRLFPPIPGVIRLVDRDLQLEHCTIPRGTCCVINIWGAGRSAHSWGADAARFRPERWTERRAARPAPAFIPFSYGRRACIGKKYAMAIMKTVLAHCLREFTFTSSSKAIECKIDISLKPLTEQLIQVEMRK